jgi:ribonuclease HI
MIKLKYIYILLIILIIIFFHSKKVNLTIKENYDDNITCNSCKKHRRKCDSCNYIENFNEDEVEDKVNFETCKTHKTNNKNKKNKVTFDLTPQMYYY